MQADLEYTQALREHVIYNKELGALIKRLGSSGGPATPPEEMVYYVNGEWVVVNRLWVTKRRSVLPTMLAPFSEVGV